MDKIATNKFKDVPIDEQTTILFSQETKVGEIDALFEIWIYERVVKAQSLIFRKDEIQHLHNEDLIKMITEEMNYFDVKISEVNEDYVFANFGYQILNEFTLEPIEN